MNVLVVGSTALDSIKTHKTVNPLLLGGSASHASVAASFFCPVQLVGIVGDDFPRRYVEAFRHRRIDLAGLQRAPGKTFHWSGEYEINMNNRRTLKTELGVFARFSPDLPEDYRQTPFVLLANIAPSLQIHVLNQMHKPQFVVADTMDLWLNTALEDLHKLLRQVDALVLNDSEARQLSQEDNVINAALKIHRLGPKYVIVKKGEHGSLLSGPSGFTLAPAFPLPKVIDPTGAGDSFLGGLMGYIASQKKFSDAILRRGMLYGSVVAAFCCEGFGLTRTVKITRQQIESRVRQLEKMTSFRD